MKPQIVIQNFEGIHNKNDRRSALIKGNTSKDLSTIIIIPSRGMMPTKVVQSWMSLMMPMNQKIIRMFVIGMEVGQAYNAAIENILAHPDLSKWKYIVTMEDDNMPPPDGFLRLYEGIEKFDVVGGLYWTKGVEGQPMIYGDPKAIPANFIPQVPVLEQLQECRGLGMGFNIFKLSMFKNEKIPKPWFKTVQEYTPGVGCKSFTQDLYFYENAGRAGYKFACDTRIKVGHYDYQNDLCW